MNKYIGILIRNENTKQENTNYINAIKKFNNIPILIYDYEDFQEIDKKLLLINGILLTGGEKVGRIDNYLIKYALDNKIKLLGICQGMQSMALYDTNQKLIEIKKHNHYSNNDYAHKVYLKNSKLSKILKTKEIRVNSHHKQTVNISLKFKIIGYSDDNLIEAIESKNNIFQIGVQWHPERMIDFDIYSNRLFEEFTK